MKTFVSILIAGLWTAAVIGEEPGPSKAGGTKPDTKAQVTTPAATAPGRGEDKTNPPAPTEPTDAKPDLGASLSERAVLRQPPSRFSGLLIELRKPENLFRTPRLPARPAWGPRFSTAYDPAAELLSGEPRGVVLLSFGF